MPSGCLRIGRQGAWVSISLLLLSCAACRSSTNATTDPEAKLRLERLLEFYRRYADQKGRGPTNEQAFKDFIRGLPKEERDQRGIGDDIDRFLTSPRDGQKYVVRYNLKALGGAEAIAWEQSGKGGSRFVALGMGYVEEYDEQSFNQLKK